MGCCLRFAGRDEEARSWYRRAIQMRRDLARGTGGVNTGAGADVASEVSNFTRLVATVQILADIEERAGRRAEAESLFPQLKDDAVALAARFPGPDFQGLRTMLAGPLRQNPASATPDGRRAIIQNCPLALILDSEDPYTNNNLAWALASDPDDPWFDPKQALDLARKAVALNPADGTIWNTLGVAAFRTGDSKTAADSIQKSIRINGGAGIDCFFLAMTRWHQGKREEARQWFDQAIAWIERTKSEDAQLRRFHAEAAALLSLPGPRPQPGTGGAPKAEARTDTVPQKDTEPGGSEHAR
jgi:tetratricopeptide (TPR) repeat protein